MNNSAHGLFLPGTTGNIFCTFHPPSGAGRPAGNVLFVPPFAEEMNKSRRMVAVQARRLAEAGIGVLIPDLHGTGDSEGDFGEARWEIWLDDLRTALDWLKNNHGGGISLWGLRLGSLLALDLARTSAVPFEKIVLWQPVADGALFVKQFLQLRTAGRLTGDGRAGESLDQLRAMLANGETVEIAGYDLAPQLADAIGSLRLSSPGMTPNASTHWLELALGDDPTLSPASQRVIEAWRKAGANVTDQAIGGDPFWSGKNITVVPTLIEATTRIFCPQEVA